MSNLDSMLKIEDITLPKMSVLYKAMVFTVVNYGCESWTIKKAKCWRIDGFELWCWRRHCKETQPVHFKGNRFWIFIGRTDVEAETPELWPPDVKNCLIGKDPSHLIPLGQPSRPSLSTLLKNPCIPEIKPSWSWCMIFLTWCSILFGRILLKILSSMFIRDADLWFSSFVASLSGFKIRVLVAS